jgi:hypothetical protein
MINRTFWVAAGFSSQDHQLNVLPEAFLKTEPYDQIGGSIAVWPSHQFDKHERADTNSWIVVSFSFGAESSCQSSSI